MDLITREELKEILEKALKILYVKDRYLLKHNCHERSITHKLAEYLQELLPQYNVDCEYNLDIDNKDNRRKRWISQKVIENIRQEIENSRKSLNESNWNLSEEIEKLSKGFYPDIIVHRRGSNNFNKLVIEGKKGNLNSDLDVEKLTALTSQDGEPHYRYLLGAQISFDIENDLDITGFTPPVYYANGQQL